MFKKLSLLVFFCISCLLPANTTSPTPQNYTTEVYNSGVDRDETHVQIFFTPSAVKISTNTPNALTVDPESSSTHKALRNAVRAALPLQKIIITLPKPSAPVLATIIKSVEPLTIHHTNQYGAVRDTDTCTIDVTKIFLEQDSQTPPTALVKILADAASQKKSLLRQFNDRIFQTRNILPAIVLTACGFIGIMTMIESRQRAPRARY